MKRGSIAILIILLVAVGAAAVSLWYHYANQKLVQDFWGSGAAILIGRAPRVQAMQLGEPGRQMSADDEPEPPAEDDAKEGEPEEKPSQVAFEFDQTPWLVVATKDAAKARGIGNLRRALVLDSTFEWSEPTSEPHWQYALDMTDDRDWVAVLFDFDTRQVAMAGGRRTAVMNAAAATEFKKFFDEQFAEGAEKPTEPAAEPPKETPADADAAAEAAEPSADAKPAAEAKPDAASNEEAPAPTGTEPE